MDSYEPELPGDEHPLVGRRVYHATFGHGLVTAVLVERRLDFPLQGGIDHLDLLDIGQLFRLDFGTIG